MDACYGPAMPEPRRAALIVALTVVAGCAIRVPAATQPPETTPRPTPTPTLVPTAGPSATATLAPIPTPDPTVLDLEVIGCPGGVVLDWSPSTNPEFHHYIALRSRDPEIATDYPPLEPAVDWGDTFTTDRFVTSAVDASILPSDQTWHYRVMAYDEIGAAVAASSVRSAQIGEPVDLGDLDATVAPDGAVTLSWSPFEGNERCFTAYRLLAGSDGVAPGTLTIVSDQGSSSLTTDALHSGATYELRVEAARTTTLGSFVLGETDPVFFTVP
jgi:hypothetical protein